MRHNGDAPLAAGRASERAEGRMEAARDGRTSRATKGGRDITAKDRSKLTYLGPEASRCTAPSSASNLDPVIPLSVSVDTLELGFRALLPEGGRTTLRSSCIIESPENVTVPMLPAFTKKKG